LRYKVVLLLLSAASFFVVPGIYFGPGGNDFLTSGLWAKHSAAAFWEGDFYPRWLSEIYAAARFWLRK
jgi:hypothetical protein